MGNELHWLPSKYLSSWWQSNFHFRKDESKENSILIQNHLESLSEGNKSWCNTNNVDFGMLERPFSPKQYDKIYSICAAKLQSSLDKVSFESFTHELRPGQFFTVGSMDWSPIYASLPVIRTTVVREPFSWLVTRFFWTNRQKNLELKCLEVDFATVEEDDRSFYGVLGKGWANRYALQYLFYLCGEGKE